MCAPHGMPGTASEFAKLEGFRVCTALHSHVGRLLLRDLHGLPHVQALLPDLDQAP